MRGGGFRIWVFETVFRCMRRIASAGVYAGLCKPPQPAALPH